ncbi:PucR family transcriptional regulator [Mangrovactinospora gilvigrisea]|uniref:PucR family transcriptional regulator n=1 Tax=Mangrovactinospora gilvigrisea TaxID=1428644 RepID=A0A1J7BT24_9ACTN|nr:PucR family transcriptional regulator [Mangrovactinospora gilvigrisea]OIV36617.1 PucR family transcriptional regulator [Mangrovactinospora gilvigrisea]
MQPTIRQILALPVLAAGRPEVVGGGERLDRAVRWVHISESADLTGLLEGGELVLTTGLPLVGGPEAADRYLRNLTDQHAAGLVVELGTHLREVPPHLGELADAAGLPVAVLRRTIRFVHVTRDVHRLIVADRYHEVEFARTVHEVFTSLNIARADTAGIVGRAAQILGRPLVLEDLGRRVLAFDARGGTAAALLDGWERRSRMRDDPPGDAAPDSWTSVPVGFGAERWGRLVLPEPAEDADRARMVLERAAQSLQLHRMLRQEQDELVLHAHGGLLDDLLSGRIADDAEAAARAAALGLAPGARHVPLALRDVGDRPGADALTQGQRDRRLLAAARQAVASSGRTALAAPRRAGTVALLVSCPDPRAADRVAEEVCGALRSAGAAGWAAGTAAPAAALTEAAARLAEAEHVAEVAAAMPGGAGLGRPLRAADVRLRGLLALLRDDHRVQAFAESELGPLLRHDARTGEDLVGLLRTHLAGGASKTATAQATGLSRPTLYARLRLVERVLGVSLEAAESRTSLHTALMVVDGLRGGR